MACSVSDFDGLKVEECTFPSDSGQLLAGYKYFKEGQRIKGVAVIAHGFGGGGAKNHIGGAGFFSS